MNLLSKNDVLGEILSIYDSFAMSARKCDGV
jgi:hypothetical protein